MTNRIWMVVLVLALLFPFVSTIYELLIEDQMAALLTAGLFVVWIAVLALAWRSSPKAK